MSKFQTYHKIHGVFHRDPATNKFVAGKWSKPEFESLRDAKWIWKEKLDGTNIRLMFDGQLQIGGRTDNAQIPAPLVGWIRDNIESKLSEQFPSAGEEGGHITLYGEGVGPKIQKGGGNYGSHQYFVLFDVRVGRWWLTHQSVQEIADGLGIRCAPLVCTNTLSGMISWVQSPIAGTDLSMMGDRNFPMEGVVGTPQCGLLDRSGQRIITKLKFKDWPYEN